MQINIESLDKLATDADKIFLTPDGEAVLIQLLDIQKQVEDAIDAAKKKLEETALKINPNFSSIQSDKIKVYYRSYGSRYRIDESFLDQIPTELYEVKTSYSPKAKEIEEWTKTHQGMPIGIAEPDRPKSLTFSLKDKGKADGDSD